MSRAAARSTARIATVISRPTIGSASGKPADTPIAPATTASEVMPSVRACSPSATNAADPVPVAGHDLVAGEADQPGRDHHADARHRSGVEQPPDRLVAGDERGQR